MEEKRTVKLDVDYRTCDVCSLKRADYHEAVVQIRGHYNLKNLERKVQQLALEEEKRAPRDFLVKILPAKNGIDVYVSSAKLGKKIVSLLRQEGAEVLESRKLIGQTRDGRKKYKFTYVARFGGMNRA